MYKHLILSRAKRKGERSAVSIPSVEERMLEIYYDEAEDNCEKAISVRIVASIDSIFIFSEPG